VEKDVNDLRDYFDDFLNTVSVPVYLKKNSLINNNFYYNFEESNAVVKNEYIKSKKEQDKLKYQKLQLKRNKLGSIFNDKIIVSPVPFISTTRKSFSTLRNTSIHFLTENHNISDSIQFCKFTFFIYELQNILNVVILNI
jgi:hypothetical protein